MDSSTLRSRRQLLAAAVGTAAVGLIARTVPAEATNGDVVTVGGAFTGSQPTELKSASGGALVLQGWSGALGLDVSSDTDYAVFAHNTAGSHPVVLTMAKGGSTGVVGLSGNFDGVPIPDAGATGVAGYTLGNSHSVGALGVSDNGVGVKGTSTKSNGVLGLSTKSNGVYGSSAATDQAAIEGQSTGNSTGVMGWSGTGVPPQPTRNTGVYGFAFQDATSMGVYGVSLSGNGVTGSSKNGSGVAGNSESGAGVLVDSKNGPALKATSGFAAGIEASGGVGEAGVKAIGRLVLPSISGNVRITGGATSVVVSVRRQSLVATSIVLLTPRQNLGGRWLWYALDVPNQTITIHLSTSRPGATVIGWLVVG